MTPEGQNHKSQLLMTKRSVVALHLINVILFGLIGLSYHLMDRPVVVPLLAYIGMANVTFWWLLHLNRTSTKPEEPPAVPHKR